MYTFKLSISRPRHILTPREEGVLLQILDGKTNPEIANELFVAMSTVKAHISSILWKFEARNRVEAIVKAVADGWIDIIPQ